MAATVNPGNDLSCAPYITFAFVEDYIQANSRSAGTSQLNKGLKYYSEGYIFNLRSSYDETASLSTFSARCYRSMKKNESPHSVMVKLISENEGPVQVKVESASCTCAIGKSQCCGHVSGVLYLLAHYKQLGVRSIPQDVAKTSLPQTWHLPRQEKIKGMSVNQVKVCGYKAEGETRPVKSTLYNPIRSSFPSLPPLFASLSLDDPDISLLSSVPQPDELFPPLLKTNFGYFHKGSTLSHQQNLSANYMLNIVDAFYPDLPVSVEQVGDDKYSTVLTESQTTLLDSLSVRQEEAAEIEKATRLQAADRKWVRLRHHRVTASKVGEISKRKKDPEKYAEKLRSSSRTVITEAMREGIANEPVAVEAYSKVKGDTVNIYPCGIVISPKAPWMAASPDRKVLDPSSNPPFGLLEVKCPNLNNKELHQLQYLTRKDNSQLALRTTNNYYHQIQMQLAMTGLKWCDLFVWSERETHLERIPFSLENWQGVKDKADKFYFDYVLH